MQKFTIKHLGDFEGFEIIDNQDSKVVATLSGATPEFLTLIETLGKPDLDQLDIFWMIDDVQQQRPDLTDEQCRKVLRVIEDCHDANYGICWDTIDDTAAELFPES